MDNVQAGFDALNGYQSPYGSNGCVDAVVKAGSYFNPDLKAEADNGTASVPNLLTDMANKGYSITPWNGQAQKGDILVYGDDDHVVLADGNGGAFGNSSSRGEAMKYSDLNYAFGDGNAPTKVIHTGGNVAQINTNFTPDGSNINLPIQMQVDDPNEKLRTDLIQNALMAPQGNVKQHIADESSLVAERMADQHGRGVDTPWLTNQMSARQRLIEAAASEEQDKMNSANKLTRVGQLAQAIADSRNSSNSKMYASVAQALGVPLDSMQGRYITQNQLALQQIQQNAALAAEKRQQQFKMDMLQKQQDFELQKIAYQASLGGGRGGRGGGGGFSMKDLQSDQALHSKVNKGILAMRKAENDLMDKLNAGEISGEDALNEVANIKRNALNDAETYLPGSDYELQYKQAINNDFEGRDNYGETHDNYVGMDNYVNQYAHGTGESASTSDNDDYNEQLNDQLSAYE